MADRNTKICILIVTNRNSVCQSNSATGTRPCNNFPALKGLSWRSWERWKSGRAGAPSCLARQYIKKVPSLFISTLNKNKRKIPSEKKKKKKPPQKKKKKKKKKS